jgi:hypothetical protein
VVDAGAMRFARTIDPVGMSEAIEAADDAAGGGSMTSIRTPVMSATYPCASSGRQRPPRPILAAARRAQGATDMRAAVARSTALAGARL